MADVIRQMGNRQVLRACRVSFDFSRGLCAKGVAGGGDRGPAHDTKNITEPSL